MIHPKIVVRLAGGMGNQLFQFSAAIMLAKIQGLTFENILIDTRFLDKYEAKHKYEIDFISNFFTGVQVAQKLPIIISLVSRFRLAKVIDKKINEYDMISSLMHFKKACYSSKSTTAYILDGYFQHTDTIFTEEDRNLVRTFLLAAKRNLIEQVKRNSPTIGIHIRRGDYVTSKSASKVFRNIPLKYYDLALKKISCQHRVLIFSDDRELSASYAAKVGGIDVRQLDLSLEDEFCLLMACDNHIIANSTFSWWAAYLGHQFGGHVIAPKNWYHDKLRSQANPLLLSHFGLIDV
jgi:hypothetical protein